MPFTYADYLQATAGLTVTGGAVVSGSFQAFDQSYLLDALARLGPAFAGVTQLPAVPCRCRAGLLPTPSFPGNGRLPGRIDPGNPGLPCPHASRIGFSAASSWDEQRDAERRDAAMKNHRGLHGEGRLGANLERTDTYGHGDDECDPPRPGGRMGTHPTLPERLLTIAEVAEYLGVPVGTLYQWRHKRTGPQGIRVGRRVRYRPREVEAWLDSLARKAEGPGSRPRRMS